MATEFWQQELADGKEAWYAKSKAYWEKQSDSDESVMGGFSTLSEIDIEGSEVFLQKVFGLDAQMDQTVGAESKVVLECGCGNGRVANLLLQKYFRRVDLLEPVPHLLNKAEEAIPTKHGTSFCISLQDFHPPANTYHCIWFNWVLLYLTDDDLVALLKGCLTALTSDGLIVIKENISARDLVKDDSDNSVTRSDAYLKCIFAQAGCCLVHEAQHQDWPPLLYPVKLYALSPTPDAQRGFC